MKLLYIGDLAHLHNLRWTQSLADRGLRVSVLSETPAILRNVGVLPNVVPPFRPWRPFRWIQRSRRVFRSVLRQVKPDLIHIQFLGPYSVPLEEVRGCPLVVSTWGSDIISPTPEPETERRKKVAILRRANAVVASSNHLRAATASYAGIPVNSIHMIYWGVNLNQFTPSGSRADKPVVGFVKHLTPTYGPDTLIDCLPDLIASVPGIRLMMIGDGSMLQALQDRAKSLGVGKAIDWAGRIDHQRIQSYYDMMAVTAMPSRREALGVSAIESQAMGVPVVASDVGGIPEVVLDGETGLLVKPDDPQALGQAIARLLTDSELRCSLGSRGRTHVAKNFNWEDTLDGMLSIYQSAASTSRMTCSS